METKKETIKDKYQQRVDTLLMLPVLLMLGIVPLVVRFKRVALSGEIEETFSQSMLDDFYSYYKVVAIIGLVIGMIILLFLCASKRRLKLDRKLKAYLISSSLFGLMTIAATAFSNYKQVALWGAPGRAEGMIIILCYIGIMWYTIYAFNDLAFYKFILIGAGFVTVCMTLLGITQYIGKDFLITDLGLRLIVPDSLKEIRETISVSFEKARITGTLYNPNYVGSFAALLIPLFALAIPKTNGLLKRLGLVTIILCNIFLLLGSGSRAGMMGLVVSIGLLVVLVWKKIWSKKKAVVGILSVALVIGGITLFATKDIALGKIKSLAEEMTGLLTPVSKDFNYKDELPIRDLKIQDTKLQIIMKEHQLNLEVQKEGIIFTAENGEIINYILANDLYTTEDSRFSDIKFTVFYRTDQPNMVGAIGLMEREKLSFLFRLGGEQGFTLMHPYDQRELQLVEAESFGFKGKEKIGSSRGYIWSRTLPILRDTWLIGKGPDTFVMEFPQNDYFGKYYAFDDPYMLVDKPHNLYLQIAVNQGGIALIAFLIMVSLYVIDSIRLYALKNSYDCTELMGIGSMLAVVGYLVAGVFNDSTVSVAPIFWIILGVGIAINYLITHKKYE